MNSLKIIIFFFFSNFISSLVNAQALPVESLEFKQLQAIGYEIKPSNDKNWSIATLDSNKLALQKTSERTVVAAYFTRKSGLNSQQELELLRIVNKLNTEYLYQFALSDTSLACAIYIYGPHDTKSFSKIIRYMEDLDGILDKYPEIFKLLN